MNPKRTIAVIPNYNGGGFLIPCVEALLSQTPAPPDILLVDNASTDGSADAVREKFPTVRVIDMGRNTGFGTAVNKGIAESNHEFVALVNNDAYVQPGWLEKMEKFMDDRPEAGACAPKVLFHTDESVFDSVGDECTAYGFVFKRGHFEGDEGQYDETAEVFSVSAVATIYRRSMFEDIGTFDENFFAYYEDIDLCFRARLRGWRFFCYPSPLVYHRYSATSGKKVKIGTEEVYLHLTGAWIKNMPSVLALRHAPAILFFHSIVFAGVLMARLRGGARLPRVPIVRFLKAMFKQRKGIQKRRTAKAAELEAAFSKVSVTRAVFSRAAKAIGLIKQ